MHEQGVLPEGHLPVRPDRGERSVVSSVFTPHLRGHRVRWNRASPYRPRAKTQAST
jgi:hypothetical protein